MEFIKCMGDFPSYAETNLKIQNVDGELVPLKLNNIQRLLEDIWIDIEKQGMFVRLYILKARRFGVSTWVTGRFFWRTITHDNHYSVIVTHEPQATDYLFKMKKRYYDNLPTEYQAADRYNNMRKLEFNTKEGDGLDSAVRVGTANIGDFGSAMMIHDLHKSEEAKYPPETADELDTSILQCVPRRPFTSVISESTAKGIGGSFYIGYWACRFRYEIYLNENKQPKWKKTINPDADPSNMYCSIFLPSFAFLEYRAPVPEGFKRTSQEEKLAIQFNVPDEYLQWRRLTLANECKGDLHKYNQEYPHTDQEAFLASGTPSFDTEKVLQSKKIALTIPITARYQCILSTGQWLSRPNDGELMVWEEPRPGVPYLISADCSEGIETASDDRDFHSVTVWNHLTGQECATYHGREMSSYDLAAFLNHLGRRYNIAWLCPERNNIGVGVVERLQRDFDYPWIVVEEIPDPPNRPRKRYGWHTNKKTRPKILDRLITQVAFMASGIKDPKAYDEMLNFKRQSDGSHVADNGTHDDRVLDKAIGKYLLWRLTPVPVEKPKPKTEDMVNKKKSQPLHISKRSGKRPDMKAFH